MVEFINLLPAFLLVFVRVLAFFSVLPIYGHRSIPTTHKIGLALMLSWIMIFTLDTPEVLIDATFFLLVIKEILVGLSVGLIAMILLYAVQVAGGFIDFNMGFMIANVVDPQTGAQSPLIGGYLYTFALLFLLAVNGHHLLLDGIFYSYQFVPMDQVFLPFGQENIVHYIATTFNAMFIIAFQMAFPIVGSLFLVDVALGMVSRAVPQMNVFVVGMPLKILVGLPLLIVYMSVFIMVVQKLFDQMVLAMRTLLQLLGGA
ncbi:flagellar biosynthetic protein FliR [Alkalihalophilus pseudofirmus]|jgi:flagellar biosynthetic protein FliR|uniref:Flagellar biosynthetic protein FliR n=1 Tax=Alkalihalophilus marmarensis DSM 21297 TaxID=1188261 RepID=U6SNJ3_9BACI|nr:flagellar biosynthetic protein FliR [Alkalihalophilus marmarensis]ERN53299.1 flagellar biosynthesis protein FliR [Alkalihalophilus marmarensis DSM 21297]MCM3489566.1 flagellar type III secretion system protein FliR [Alkalihalophilus marmarensis]OLS37488.1 flagellar biosynthetic protein FliR [Alkalihalophilus pseudofirmus]